MSENYESGSWWSPVVVAILGFVGGFAFVVMMPSEQLPGITLVEEEEGASAAKQSVDAGTGSVTSLAADSKKTPGKPSASEPAVDGSSAAPQVQAAADTPVEPSPIMDAKPVEKAEAAPQLAAEAKPTPQPVKTQLAEPEKDPIATLTVKQGPESKVELKSAGQGQEVAPVEAPKPDTTGTVAAEPSEVTAKPSAKTAATEESRDRKRAEQRARNVPKGKWWDGLIGRRCRIGFGDVNALVVRDTKLTQNQKVLWKRHIRPHRRIARLASRADVVVTPLAFGFHPRGGRPTAAYIRFQGKGSVLEGVIPLKIGGKYLTMRPASASPAGPTP